MRRVYGKKHKNSSRPKKRGTKLKQRLLQHKARLIALGVPESTIVKLNRKEMLALLKVPKKTAKNFA